MASITFEVLDGLINNTTLGVNGSGLGFYGSGGHGTSVPLLEYQKTTFLTNADGTGNGGQVRNVEFISGVLGSSGCRLQNTTSNTGLLVNLNGTEVTLQIHFNHDVSVKVQNCQLRIYDRINNIDNPATGVITKVAEVVNFGGATYTGWLAAPGSDFITGIVGSGDAFWWGAPWPDASTYGGANVRPYYRNSVGVAFPNFTTSMDTANSGNPDTRLSSLSYPGKQTVGGTGIIVPLLDSPGSGGRGLTGMLYPKFFQYVNTTYQAAPFGVSSPVASSTAMAGSYGGTSGDLRHTWRVALSASPLNIGSKTLYGLYVSLEYL
jgi:hypothetical protein